MPKYPHIDDLDCCPHCGSDDVFYTRAYAYGHLTDFRRFYDRGRENTGMHESLRYGKASDYFCGSCNQKIATQKSSRRLADKGE